MKIIFIILLAIIFFPLFTSLLGFYISIRPPKITSHLTPKDLNLSYEDISFRTEDGLTLKGWFIPSTRPDAKTIMLLHGYPADKGNILPALAFLHTNYNFFLFDFRYLGQSEGKYSTGGAKEISDLLAAIDYLKSREINEVGVWGLSMGGAVVLMTAPSAPEIRAIVAESSYARLDLLASELYRIPFLRPALAHLTIFWGKLFFGIDARNVSPMESAKTLRLPVLVIHSKKDEVIAFRHAQLLEDALKNNPHAEFWFQEELVHGELGSEYQKRVEEFFARHL